MANYKLTPFNGQLDSEPTGSALKPFSGTLDGEKPRTRGLIEALNDNVIEFANAAAGGVSSVANMVSPGNSVSSFIDENIIKSGEQKQSDVVRAEKQRMSEGIQNAEGIAGELGAVGSYVLNNPLLAASQAAGSFVGPGAAVKGAGLAAKGVGAGIKGVEMAGRAGGVAAGAAMAGGDAAGTAYELSKTAGATEEQAIAAGRQASLIPAAVGGLTGAFGAEKLLAGGKGFTGNALSRGLKSGVSEAGQEALEEGVTQYEGQRAAMPYDATIDPSKGVAGAAGMGAIMGFGPGAVLGAIENQPVQAPSQQMGINPDAGPLSRAAASAVDAAPAIPAIQTPVEQPAPVEQPVEAAPVEQPVEQAKEPAQAPIQEPPIEESAPPAAPVPMEQRSLEELRTAFRSAQDPAIRKTIAAEIRKRREAMPEPLAQPSLIPETTTANVTETAQTFKNKTPAEKAGTEGSPIELGSGAYGLDPVGLEQSVNSASRDADFLSNLSSRKSFINKGFDDLDVNELSAVQGLMLKIAKDDKVLNSIVELIPVDVVDMLASKKLTPEMVFHNPSVLKASSVRSNANNSVSIPVDAAAKIVRAMASVAAKNLPVDKLSHSGGLAVNGSPAANAVVPSPIDVIGGLAGLDFPKMDGGAGSATENMRGSVDLGFVSPNLGAALKTIGDDQISSPKDAAIVKQAGKTEEEVFPQTDKKVNKLNEPAITEPSPANAGSSTQVQEAAQPDAGALTEQAPKKDRKYIVTAINEKTGKRTVVSPEPMTHAQAVNNKGRFTASPNVRIQLEDVTNKTVERPDGWRSNAIKARKVAASIGIDGKGKRLADLVAEIDAKDGEKSVAARSYSLKSLADSLPDDVVSSTFGDSGYIYHSKLRPFENSQASMLGQAIEVLSDRVFKTSQPITAEKIAALELAPVSPDARMAAAKDIATDGFFAATSKTGQITLVTPSAKNPGKFQRTIYDKKGPVSDAQHDTIEDAIVSAADAGYSKQIDADRAEKLIQGVIAKEPNVQDAPQQPAITEAAPDQAPEAARDGGNGQADGVKESVSQPKPEKQPEPSTGAGSVSQPETEAPSALDKYDAEAKAYGYSVGKDGVISLSNGKQSSVKVSEKKGRLRIESGAGNLLFSGATTPDAFGSFLRKFWGAEKKAESKPVPRETATPNKTAEEARIVELRKRKSVLQSLLKCVSS